MHSNRHRFLQENGQHPSANQAAAHAIYRWMRLVASTKIVLGLLFLLPLLLFMGRAYADSALWVVQMGGNIDDSGQAVAIDSTDAVLTTGSFQNIADFAPGGATFNLQAVDDKDAFVSKLDSAGSRLWAVKFGGTKDEVGLGIHTDSADNVYTIGYFDKTIDLDPSGAVDEHTAVTETVGVSTKDIFIAKLSANGGYLWGVTIGAEHDDRGYSITTDGDGNVLATGNFFGTTNFDPLASAAGARTSPNRNTFIVKLSGADGAFRWVRYFDSNSPGNGFDITTDNANNVYTTGYFNSNTDFNSAGTPNIVRGLDRDIFITKHASDGSFQWVYTASSTGSDVGYAIANVGTSLYVAGTFTGTLDFNPSGLSEGDTLTSFGDADIFVMKLDTNANFQWVRQMGGVGRDEARDLSIDATGRVYTTGFFNDTADFDPSAALFNLSAMGGRNGFLSILDADGEFVSASALGAGAETNAYGVAVDGSSHPHVVGDFDGTGDFDPDAAATKNLASVNMDIYVLQLDAVGLPTNQPPIAQDDAPPALVQDTSTVINVLADNGNGADSDPEGDPLTIVAVGIPNMGGSATITGTASIAYTPAAAFVGTEVFTYTINDGTPGNNATATVTMNVVAVGNNAPIANADTVTASEDVALDIALVGSDSDGNPLTFSIVSAPVHGALGAVMQQSTTSAAVLYTPTLNYNGADSLDFEVDDGQGGKATATINITVEAVNDAPTAEGVIITVGEDMTATVMLAGSDIDGDALTFTPAAPTHGALLNLQPTGDASAQVVYAPNANYNGADSFQVEVNDGQGGSVMMTVSITVEAANDAPTADAVSVTVQQDSAVLVPLTAADIDGDILSFAILKQPEDGTLGTVTPKGDTSAEVVYKPNAGFSGMDSFEIMVDDGNGGKKTIVVTVSVKAMEETTRSISLPLIFGP